MPPGVASKGGHRGSVRKKLLLGGNSRIVYRSAGSCRRSVRMGRGVWDDKGEGYFDHLDFLRNHWRVNGTVQRNGVGRFNLRIFTDIYGRKYLINVL